MRKIKFRMWNPLGRDGRGRYHYGKQAMECLTQQSIGLYDHEKDGCIFEQFTGLRDKNGKEIYEGDIVEVNLFSPSVMQIAFIEGAFCLSNFSGEYIADIHYIHHAGIEQSEVIGNIHENPEYI